MKYSHHFINTEIQDSYRIYEADGVSVRLDFFDHILRAAIIRKDEYLIPTWSVCPKGVMPREGRDKLSTDGFDLIRPEVTETDKVVSFQIDDVDVTIDLHNFHMKFQNENGILFEDRDYIAHNFGHELGRGSQHYISRQKDEKIFGLGDKTGNVNKNGNSYRISTSDAMGFNASSSDPLYKQIPFYICSNRTGSYGIYYDTYSNGTIDFGREINNYYIPFKSFRCEEENLVFYIIFGSVPEILRRFSQMCGDMFMPPKWSLQYCGSTMAYTDADDADRQLRNFISLCETYDLHPGGFYLSSGYTQINEQRCVFHWNTDKIPDPEGLSAYFKAHGVEFLPNVKPAFLTTHPMYEMIAQKGWFLHYKDGKPAIFPFWAGFGSYMDFTNSEAFDFWTDCVRTQLVDKGYRNIWNDNNEYDVCDREVYASGFGTEIQACLIRPLFSYLMSMASLEAQDHSIRTYAVSRSGIAGLGRIAATWTGDNHTGFDDFRYNHKMAMTMSLSGIYNFGQDIGGFAGPCPDEELFFRWIQYGLFTPRFTLHSWNPDGSSTMPWLYPQKMKEIKALFDLRDTLIPYLYNEMYRSVCTHDPIIYPLFLKYPEADVESDVFFCGDSILACPVFDRSADTVQVSLPSEDVWYYQERQYSGNVCLPCAYDGLPVYFIKAGTILPWNGEWVIFPLKEGSFDGSFLMDDGMSNLGEEDRILNYHVICESQRVIVEINMPMDGLRLVHDEQRKLVVRIKK